MADISKAVLLKGKFDFSKMGAIVIKMQFKQKLSFVKYYCFMKMQAKINRLLQNIKCNFTTFSIEHKAYSLGYSKNANKSRYSLYLLVLGRVANLRVSGRVGYCNAGFG